MTVILVTGASGSIGRATAVRLARGGHRVYAAARRQEPLDALASQEPGIQAVPLDVTDADSIAAAADRINTRLLATLPARLGDRIKTRITSGQAAVDPAAVRPGA